MGDTDAPAAAPPENAEALREHVLACDDREAEQVPCPEWGLPTQLWVRRLEADERDAFDASQIPSPGESFRDRLGNLRARLVAMSTVDREGRQVFQPRDVKLLGKKHAGAVDRLFAVAQHLSKINQADVDELAGNSESGP